MVRKKTFGHGPLILGLCSESEKLQRKTVNSQHEARTERLDSATDFQAVILVSQRSIKHMQFSNTIRRARAKHDTIQDPMRKEGLFINCNAMDAIDLTQMDFTWQSQRFYREIWQKGTI